jgi:plastocyanin
MPINFPSNPVNNQIYNFSNTSWRWDGISWTVVSGNDVVSTNGFSTIEVTGQDNVVATTFQDVLKIIEGDNVTLETNATEKSITITSTASGGGGGSSPSNTFETISVEGQTNVVASSDSDVLTLVAGAGISITTDPDTDAVIFNNTELFGNIAFTDLDDAAGLTVDRFYLPAITMLRVSNNGATAYRFDQYGNENNPTVYAINGTTIAFNLAASGHPFLIQNPAGQNYNTGLTHVSTAGVVSTGSAAQGKDSGTLYWKIPTDISGGYRYQCSVHGTMVGSIFIKTISTL